MNTVVKLPSKHAIDWYERCDHATEGCFIVSQTARTVTLSLTELGLRDLLDDAKHYADNMGPESTGDVDYRPAARRCLAALSKQGHTP